MADRTDHFLLLDSWIHHLYRYYVEVCKLLEVFAGLLGLMSDTNDDTELLSLQWGNDDDAFDQLKLLRSRTSLVSVRVRPHYAVLPFTDDTRQGWELGAEAAGANILTKYVF